MDNGRKKTIDYLKEFNRLLGVRYGVSPGDLTASNLRKVKDMNSLSSVDRILLEIGKDNGWKRRKDN